MASKEYLKLLEDMASLHQRKSAGYVGSNPDVWSNFRECADFGIDPIDGIITRMSDKWSRLKSLFKNPSNDQVNESIEDTLMDLSAYSLILICMLREEKLIDKTT